MADTGIMDGRKVIKMVQTRMKVSACGPRENDIVSRYGAD